MSFESYVPEGLDVERLIRDMEDCTEWGCELGMDGYLKEATPFFDKIDKILEELMRRVGVTEPEDLYIDFKSFKIRQMDESDYE